MNNVQREILIELLKYAKEVGTQDIIDNFYELSNETPEKVSRDIKAVELHLQNIIDLIEI